MYELKCYIFTVIDILLPLECNVKDYFSNDIQFDDVYDVAQCLRPCVLYNHKKSGKWSVNEEFIMTRPHLIHFINTNDFICW